MAQNTRLQRAIRDAKLTTSDIGRRLGVSERTVHRWIGGTTPYEKNRWALAKLVGGDAEYLWPESVQLHTTAGDELVAAYATRSEVPTSLWWDLISSATRHIDLLGYTLYFLSLQHPTLVEVLQSKCAAGTQVRAAIADPDSDHVSYRDREEGSPLTLVVRIKTTLDAWRPLIGRDGFELRYQDAPLYNSVFRFDDNMLVTPHLYGTPGSHAPLLHLKRIGDGGLFARFAQHFDSIWDHSARHEEA